MLVEVELLAAHEVHLEVGVGAPGHECLAGRKAGLVADGFGSDRCCREAEKDLYGADPCRR